MRASLCRALFLAGTALGATAAMASDPTPAEQRKIDNSLDASRVIEGDGTALSSATSGYYQLVLAPSGLTQAQLCPLSNQERDALKQAETKIWNWALGKKRDWGAAVRVVYDGRAPDWDNKDFAPNAWMRLFSAYYDGDAVGKCRIPAIDNARFYAPLVPIEEGVPREVAVEFSTWYNKTVDRARIDQLTKGGAFLLGAVGVPVGFLTPQVSTAFNGEIKDALDKKRASVFRTKLFTAVTPRAATGYLGVRAPATPPGATDARVAVTLAPVASIFAPTETSYATVDLSGWSEANVLNFPVPDGAGATRSLATAITARGSVYGNFTTAADDAAATALCKQLGDLLVYEMKLSRTDAALIQYAAARQRTGGNAAKLGKLRKIGCVADAAAMLKTRLKVTVPDLIDDRPVGVPATRARMDDLMEAFSGMAKSAAPGQGLLWKATAFPLPVYDVAGVFGWTESRRAYTFDARDDLRKVLFGTVTNVACWARFPDGGGGFAPGLDAADPARARKSAALVRMADGQVLIAQFRYDDEADGARIDGIAFTKQDPASIAQMRGNASCDQDWMKPILNG